MVRFCVWGLGAILLLLLIGCTKKSIPLSAVSAQKHPVTKHTVTSYLAQRKAWKADNQAHARWAVIQPTTAELTLDVKLRQLRKQMKKTYQENNYFPGAGNFYQSKSHIEQTRLFRILRHMPKGGLLHLHPPAAGSADWIIDKALNSPDCYVYWQGAHAQYITGQLGFFRKNEVPNGFFPIKDLDLESGDFRDSLRTLLTFNEHIFGDSVDIWKEFELIFQRISAFTTYQPVFRDYYLEALGALIKDGIQHVELREMYAMPMYDLVHPSGYYNADTIVRYYREIQEALKQKEPDFTLKTIYTDIRFKSKKDISASLVHAFKLRKKYPDMVKGFDLVAEEDAGNTTLYYLDSWLLLDSLTKVYGVNMPLYFHGGESDWGSVENLYDCILLGSKRIGHGFNLFKFPKLMTEVRNAEICLEINPLSNQILGYIRDLRIHPASYYISQGIPVTISSDDPMIFDYRGLSYDFWAAFMAWELNVQALKQLAMDSLIYSALSEEEKNKAFQAWELKWNAFVEYANGVLGGIGV